MPASLTAEITDIYRRKAEFADLFFVGDREVLFALFAVDRHSAHVGGRERRVERDGPGVIGQGEVLFAEVIVNTSSAVVGIGIFRVVFDRLFKI